MWIFTTSGFLSVVRHAEPPATFSCGPVSGVTSTRSAPPREHLTPSRRQAGLPLAHRRAAATFAAYLAAQAEAIDYGNFKNAVAPARVRTAPAATPRGVSFQPAPGGHFSSGLDTCEAATSSTAWPRSMPPRA